MLIVVIHFVVVLMGVVVFVPVMVVVVAVVVVVGLLCVVLVASRLTSNPLKFTSYLWVSLSGGHSPSCRTFSSSAT